MGAGQGRRIDLGEGVTLDLIRVGEDDGAYYLGRFPVTQAQYGLVMGGNPSAYRGDDHADHSVENVTWDDAMAFCEKLNERFGKEFPGFLFVLPWKWQWKEAAYAGGKTVYAGGDDLGEVAWYCGNSDGHSHVVGTKGANAWGFHDMSGNVAEWCLDDEGGHSLVGGSWIAHAEGCRIGYHGAFSYDIPGIGCHGFRISLEPAEWSGRRDAAAAVARRRAAARATARAAAEALFLEKVKAGKASRFDIGNGIRLDLIRIGEGDDAYYLGRFPVTQGQYEAVTGGNPSRYDGDDRALHPVEEVSWNDAMSFCAKLNDLPAERRGGLVFTLPTEAQWEKAAYAGEETLYAGGDDLDEVGWYFANSDRHTHAVGEKKPNAWGLYDMSGNVCEWCLDEEADGDRAYRGGGWSDGGGRCRVGRRRSYDPGFRNVDFGFRVAASRSSK